MTRRPGDTDPLPPSPRGDDDVDIHPGYTPDAFKKKTAQSHGEAAAAFQSEARAPGKGEDTQDLKPAVLIDVTKQEGFSGDEIRKLVAEMEVERQRERKTVVVEKPTTKPTNRISLFMLLGAALLVLAIIVALARAHQPAEVVNSAPSTTASSAASQAPTGAANAAPSIDVTASTTFVTASASAVAVPPATAPNVKTSSSSHPASSSAATAHATPTPSAASSHHANDVPSGAL